jgi:rod shape determining protein RodA
MRIVVGQSDFDVRDARISVINYANLRRIDWFMALIVLSLVLAGWLALYSASQYSESGYFSRQVVAFFVGAFIAAVIVVIDYRFVVIFAPAMYLAAVGTLFAVLEFGHTAKGSERWLQIGPVGVQPSELTKLVMVYFLAWYLNALGERIKKFYWFALTFILVGIPIVLILKQPNLGTALCLAPLVVVMLFVAGCRWRHMALVAIAGFSLVPVLYWQMKDFDARKYLDERKRERTQKVVAASSEENAAEKEAPKKGGILAKLELKDYQKMRIYSFLHPEEDKSESGWQTYQSLITVGSGGLSGKGYMQGTQTKLKWLPEHHTDFIFSVVAEEMGFIGASIIIGLFAAFLLRGLMFARDCPT